MAESKLTKVGYELESINIVQAPISDIEHRSECDPKIDFYGRKVYPVIVAPMGSVTDENNYKIWLEHNLKKHSRHSLFLRLINLLSMMILMTVQGTSSALISHTAQWLHCTEFVSY